MPKTKAQIQMEIDIFGREMLTDSDDEPGESTSTPVRVKSKKKKRNQSLGNEGEVSAKIPKPALPERKVPIWKDDDDEIGDAQGLKDRKGFKKVPGKQDSKYRTRLEESFQLVHGPTPGWAQMSKSNSKTDKKQLISVDTSDDSDDGLTENDVLNSTLSRNTLEIVKVLDLNNSCHNPEIIRSVQFHPTAQVGLVAGAKNKVSLVKVDGKDNSLIQTVPFEGFQIHHATFSADGSEFYVSSGKSGEFWAYEMTSGTVTKVQPSLLTKNETIRRLVVSPDNKILVTVGHHGNMFIRAKESKEVIETLKANSEQVNAVAFDPNGQYMFASTAGGEIFQYDMRKLSCTGKLTDDGAVNGSSLAVSKYHLATGSDSGIVNIYDVNAVCKGLTDVRPLKTFKNLRTKITSLQFNHSGDILAMASNEKPNAFRLAHMESMTVYSNFPYVNALYKRPNCLAFSPNDGYLSLGNNTGSAYLFRIKHYENY